MFKDKILVITGGTGSFGNAVLERFLSSNLKEIRIFSRDEKKQHEMRVKYNNPKLKFHIGDVKDYSSISNVMISADYVFHAAALKQVPSCEFYPIEAVKTNVLGTENVLSSAIFHGVKKVICLSTDKAVYPINAMGISKAMMEKVFVAKSRESNNTVICGTRYGNVMASRGSVIPHFYNQIVNNESISVTDPTMTRFMMTLEDAVDLVIFAFTNGNSGDIFVQKSPATNIGNLAEIMKKLYKSNVEIKIIGTRHAEKKHETLLSSEERIIAQDLGNYFRIPSDDRDLNYNKYFSEGINNSDHIGEYNSFNTEQLSKKKLTDLLSKIGFKGIK